MSNFEDAETAEGSLIAIIGDEDTVTGFLLAGIGHLDLRRKSNYLVVDDKTTVEKVSESFKEFTSREPIPAVLEIPSKDHPYDPKQDSILSRVTALLGNDGVE